MTKNVSTLKNENNNKKEQRLEDPIDESVIMMDHERLQI